MFACAHIHDFACFQLNAVFLLWGNFAKKKGKTINKLKHTVIESAHPSPLSARCVDSATMLLPSVSPLDPGLVSLDYSA